MLKRYRVITRPKPLILFDNEYKVNIEFLETDEDGNSIYEIRTKNNIDRILDENEHVIKYDVEE